VDALSDVQYFWILPSAVLSLLSFAFRALRWKLILSPSLEISFSEAFHPMMAGFMINCLLPARAGEMVRPVILYKRHHLAFSTGLSTIVVERMFDMVCMVLFLAVILCFFSIPPDAAVRFQEYKLDKDLLNTIGSGMVKLSGIIILGIVLLSNDSCKRRIDRLLLRLPGLFFFAGPGFRLRLAQWISLHVMPFINNISSGFQFIKRLENIFFCLFLSILVWGIQASAWYVLLFGFAGIQLGYLQISAVMILVCFFIALPSVPGYWGLWEIAGIFAMQLLGIPEILSAGYTLVNHAVQIFTIVLIGLISVFFCSFDIRSLNGFQRK